MGADQRDGSPQPERTRTTTLRASGLIKRFESTVAVDGVDLALAAGEVRGLLGPNGAGKTTLLRMLFGLLSPDAGTIELLGRPQEGPRSTHLDGVAGFVEDPRFYPYLSGRANLEVLAELDGGRRTSSIDDALQRVGLGSQAGQRVSGYSTGMRQRLGIAASLLRRPRLLLLDEPTSGLDPAGALDVNAILQALSAEGVSVLLSSHQISEVEKVCDTFTMLCDGRVAWDGTAAELRRQAPAPTLRLATADDQRAAVVGRRHPTITIEPDGGALRVTGSEEHVDALVVDLGREGVAVRRMELLASPLETVFFAMTAETHRSGGFPPPERRKRDRVP